MHIMPAMLSLSLHMGARLPLLLLSALVCTLDRRSVSAFLTDSRLIRTLTMIPIQLITINLIRIQRRDPKLLHLSLITTCTTATERQTSE